MMVAGCSDLQMSSRFIDDYVISSSLSSDLRHDLVVHGQVSAVHMVLDL